MALAVARRPPIWIFKKFRLEVLRILDRKSIYALNKKDPDAIVYSDVDKHLIRLTREDFDTEVDFLKWKAWSGLELTGFHVTAKNGVKLNLAKPLKSGVFSYAKEIPYNCGKFSKGKK